MDSQIGGKRKEKKIKKSTDVKGTVVGHEPSQGSIDCHGILQLAGLVTIVCRGLIGVDRRSSPVGPIVHIEEKEGEISVRGITKKYSTTPYMEHHSCNAKTNQKNI